MLINNFYKIIEVQIIITLLCILAIILYIQYVNFAHNAVQDRVFNTMSQIRQKQAYNFALMNSFSCDLTDELFTDLNKIDKKYLVIKNNKATQRFLISIESCEPAGESALYSIVVQNDIPSYNQNKVKWIMKCGLSSNSICEPRLVVGNEMTLQNIF